MNDSSNIIEILENASENIRKAGQKKVEASEQLRIAKHQLKVAKAKATIKHQDAKNQKILEALVDTDEEVIPWETSVIKAQTKYESGDIEHTYEDNLFVASRKIASMDEKELCAISGSVIVTKNA